jgi:hypothetical protein
MKESEFLFVDDEFNHLMPGDWSTKKDRRVVKTKLSDEQILIDDLNAADPMHPRLTRNSD